MRFGWATKVSSMVGRCAAFISSALEMHRTGDDLNSSMPCAVNVQGELKRRRGRKGRKQEVTGVQQNSGESITCGFSLLFSSLSMALAEDISSENGFSGVGGRRSANPWMSWCGVSRCQSKRVPQCLWVSMESEGKPR